ncbi:hypothetical protein RHGRI_013201 [Rhododendron griersonianum]|uniref:Uncharacterized protein n=1 Tax=Rhododendron griersonianum TaxID=479676 RepID=A0AAV6K4N7_9ERIC|nr:hypothetical protein RHGRI_013201 [Rhododendron griersonianum]
MSYGYPTTSTMYYLIPSLGLTKGLRVLNSDIEVREMLDVYKGLPVMCLYCEKGPEPLQIIYPDEVDVPHVETNVVHLDDESPKANEGNHEVVVDKPVDEGIGDDEDEEDDPDYVADEEDEDEDDEDGSDVSSTPSWMFENLEGPGDDDIFASKEQQNQRKDDKEQPQIEDWSCKNPIHPNSKLLKKKDLPSTGQPKKKKSRTTAPTTSTQPSVDAGFYTKPAESFVPINPGFYTQPNQGSANSANPEFSSQPSKLQCIGGKFGGSGPRFSVGVANRGGGQTSGARGGGKVGASRGGGRSSGTRGGGRSGATRGGGRVGATRGGGRAGATRGGGRTGGPRGGGRTGGPRGGGRSGAAQTGLAQTGAAQSEGREPFGREGGWWW